jgi:transposase
MSNVLDQQKQHDIVALGRVGWSLRRIEAATGVRRETVGEYLRAAGVPVRGRGRRSEAPAKPAIVSPGVSTDPPAKPAIDPGVSTDSAPARAPSASACAIYRDIITEALARGRNAMAIWQDLVDDHGFTARYASVRRFVRSLREASTAEARVVITTAPGEEAQVDYGEGPMVRDPATGKYKRTRLFVLTLGYSRKAVRLLVWRSSVQIWAELHEQAFRRLGGTVKVIILDNLKEACSRPTSTIPHSIRSIATSSRTTASSPCRVAWAIPIAKAKSRRVSGTRRRRH